MKIAVFGDVHANLEALTAVLDDAAKMGVSQFACTGDLVGYNANPHECVEAIRKLGCPVVMGNHEEEAVNGEPILGMNSRARMAMEWTRANLTREDKTWLSNLEMVRQVSDFTVVHATLDSPRTWAYVMNRFDALASFSYQFTNVCFFGHTHMPVVYIRERSQIICQRPVEPIRIEPGRKYFINTGSVGQPRDGDRRAAYAVYDMERAEVEIRRIPYDLETAMAKVKRGPLKG